MLAKLRRWLGRTASPATAAVTPVARLPKKKSSTTLRLQLATARALLAQEERRCSSR